MKLLLAFDSFKESMTSLQAAAAFERGFARVGGRHRFETVLISDGGEGFMEALIYGRGRRCYRQVSGPLGDKTRAPFGLIQARGKKIAVVEMAHASGLEMVPRKKRNPMKTSSCGTGELIAAALKAGAREIIVGIGGSATVDGGIGMAAALGARFYDAKGRELRGALSGRDLGKIARIDTGVLNPLLKKARFTVACDVSNTLCGKRGAAAVFGPQKGATPQMVEELDRGLANLAKVIKRDLGVAIKSLPGSGAAGGIGAMLMALSGAQLQSGIDIVLDSIDFSRKAAAADLIVTGEGCIDSQSLHGKTISGIAKRAAGAKVVAIGGAVLDAHLDGLYEAGIAATLPLVTRPVELSTAIAEGTKAMAMAGERLARLLALNA